jgi:hypothetical protein
MSDLCCSCAVVFASTECECLRCIVIHYTVLHSSCCPVLHYTVLHYTVLHYTVLYCPVLHYTVPYGTIAPCSFIVRSATVRAALSLQLSLVSSVRNSGFVDSGLLAQKLQAASILISYCYSLKAPSSLSCCVLLHSKLIPLPSPVALRRITFTLH